MPFARWTPMLIILMNMSKILQVLCSSETFTWMTRLLHNGQMQQQQQPVPTPTPSPAPTPMTCSLDLEIGAGSCPDWRGAGPSYCRNHSLSWEKTVVTLCLTSVLEVALTSVQKDLHLPLSLYMFNVFLFFGFSSLIVGKYMDCKFWIIGRALRWISVFFVATAFVLATTIPYRLWLRCCTWAIYGISLLAIFISRCL